MQGKHSVAREVPQGPVAGGGRTETGTQGMQVRSWPRPCYAFFRGPMEGGEPGRCPGRTGREEEPGPGAPMTACPRPAPHFQEPALQVTQRVPLLSLRLPPPCFSTRYHIMGQVPSDRSHCHFFLLSRLSFPSPDTTVLSFIPSSCNHPSPSPLRSRPLG